MVSAGHPAFRPGGPERGAAGPSFASPAHIQLTLAAVKSGNSPLGGPSRLRTQLDRVS